MIIDNRVSTVGHVPNGEGFASSSPSAQAGDASVLPAPMQQLATASDLGSQLSALILEISHEQKKGAHLARQEAEKAQRTVEDHELEEMREEADAKLAAGVAGGVMEVASAGIAATGIGKNQDGRLAADCASKLYAAMGKVDSALLSHEASMAGIEAKKAGNAVGHEKIAIEDAREREKDARASIDKALDFYKEYLAAKADAQRAAFLKA